MSTPIGLSFGGSFGFFAGDGVATLAPETAGLLPATASPLVFLDPATRAPSSPMFIYPPLYTVLFDVEPPAPTELEVKGGPDEGPQRYRPRHRFQKSLAQLMYEARAALDAARQQEADEVSEEEDPTTVIRTTTIQLEQFDNLVAELLLQQQSPVTTTLLVDMEAARQRARLRLRRANALFAAIATATHYWF